MTESRNDQSIPLTPSLVKSLLGVGEVHGRAKGFMIGLGLGILAGVSMTLTVIHQLSLK